MEQFQFLPRPFPLGMMKPGHLFFFFFSVKWKEEEVELTRQTHLTRLTTETSLTSQVIKTGLTSQVIKTGLD